MVPELICKGVVTGTTSGAVPAPGRAHDHAKHRLHFRPLRPRTAHPLRWGVHAVLALARRATRRIGSVRTMVTRVHGAATADSAQQLWKMRHAIRISSYVPKGLTLRKGQLS